MLLSGESWGGDDDEVVYALPPGPMTLKGVAGVILFIQLRRQSTLQCKFYESPLNQRSNVQNTRIHKKARLSLNGKLTNTNRTFVAARGAVSANLMLVTRKRQRIFDDRARRDATQCSRTQVSQRSTTGNAFAQLNEQCSTDTRSSMHQALLKDHAGPPAPAPISCPCQTLG